MDGVDFFFFFMCTITYTMPSDTLALFHLVFIVIALWLSMKRGFVLFIIAFSRWTDMILDWIGIKNKIAFKLYYIYML